MVIDTLFLIATAALGWGLSLATYRLAAVRHRWPMGKLQTGHAAIPLVLGLAAVVIAGLFAAARGETGGWVIVGAGVLLAMIWTGLLRVASQVSLFLAPAAAVLLVLGWAGVGVPDAIELLPQRTFADQPGIGSVAGQSRAETMPHTLGTSPRVPRPSRVEDRTLLQP